MAMTASTGQGSHTPPSLPSPPAPAPIGGFSPAAASSAAFAFSIFLALTSLLVLGASRAGRRMRLVSKPWRPAPFLLMPERPG